MDGIIGLGYYGEIRNKCEKSFWIYEDFCGGRCILYCVFFFNLMNIFFVRGDEGVLNY